jgi:hypothetical protein
MASGTSLRPTATSSAAAAAATRPSTPLPLLLPLDVPVRHSADVWQDDLAALFAQAKERFGDVSWQVRQTATTTAGAVTTTTTTVTAWHSGHDEPLGRLDNAMAVASRPSGATKVHA